MQARLPAESTIGRVDIAKMRSDIARLDANLAQIEQAISDGVIKQRLAEIRAAQQDLDQLDGFIQIFIDTPPDVVVAPLRQTYSNVRGAAYSAVVYYAPGVLALLVQHTAITLGALALVRERRMGAFEVFRVAPVNMIQLLIGKYLGYTLFISLSSATLIVLLRLLGIPLLGNLALFVALLLLLHAGLAGAGLPDLQRLGLGQPGHPAGDDHAADGDLLQRPVYLARQLRCPGAGGQLDGPNDPRRVGVPGSDAARACARRAGVDRARGDRRRHIYAGGADHTTPVPACLIGQSYD